MTSKEKNFSIYEYDAQLLLAFQTDCTGLLQKFSEHQSYRYGTFAEVWKENQFIAIFEGQTHLLMIQTFLENCFMTVNKFLFSPDPYIQAGALYTMYALYYKQPIREWVRIRITQAEAKQLNQIIIGHKGDQPPEILYCYSKMRLDGAFICCALSQPLGLDQKYLRRFDLGSERSSTCKITGKDTVREFKKFVESDSLLQQLRDTDKEYQNLVKQYNQKGSKVFVFPSKLESEIQKAYATCFNKQGEISKLEKHERLKKKAMKNTNAIYRADKQVLTALDLEQPSQSTSKHY